jgi:hypothetical protein
MVSPERRKYGVAGFPVLSVTSTGPYNSVCGPGFACILSYTTSATLSGVGSISLHGTLFVRPGAGTHRLASQFVMHNGGGSMIVDVFESLAPRNYTYKVVRARRSDALFKGGTGELMIIQSTTFSVPFYTNGQATMTFTPG